MFGKMKNAASGVGNMMGMIKKAQDAQKRMQEINESFSTYVLEKEFPNVGKLKMTGDFSLSMDLSKEFVALSTEDRETASDLMAVAVNTMHRSVDEYRANELKKVTDGLDLGDMGKMLGLS